MVNAVSGTRQRAARDAKARGDFRTMRDVLRGVRAVQGDKAGPDLVQQLALATYKSNDPDAKGGIARIQSHPWST